MDLGLKGKTAPGLIARRAVPGVTADHRIR